MHYEIWQFCKTDWRHEKFRQPSQTNFWKVFMHLFKYTLSVHLKTSESRKMFWCFQGVEKECIENKWFKLPNFKSIRLWEMCPKTEFFLVRIFLYSDWIRRDKYLSVFSPNEGKYKPEKTPHLDTFHAV